MPGAQNLPQFADYTNPDDHRQALQTAREAAKQAINSLPKGERNFDVKSYLTVLRAYVRHLPKAAGIPGNILIANERAYMLRRMYDLDRPALPSFVIAALESLLRSHGALAAFYDIVARHEAAIPSEPWAKPFPEYAIADARKAVRAYTPKYFEQEVAAGLHQVEKTAPPEAQPRARGEAAPNVLPPPLVLPAVRDELRSDQKLLAGGCNALWGTFREGETRVPDRAEWNEAAQRFGAAVAPLLGWLDAVKDQKRIEQRRAPVLEAFDCERDERYRKWPLSPAEFAMASPLKDTESHTAEVFGCAKQEGAQTVAADCECAALAPSATEHDFAFAAGQNAGRPLARRPAVG